MCPCPGCGPKNRHFLVPALRSISRETDFVRDCFEKGGMKVATIFHPGGHSVPIRDKEALNSMVEWIVDTAVKKRAEASSSRL